MKKPARVGPRSRHTQVRLAASGAQSALHQARAELSRFEESSSAYFEAELARIAQEAPDGSDKYSERRRLAAREAVAHERARLTAKVDECRQRLEWVTSLKLKSDAPGWAPKRRKRPVVRTWGVPTGGTDRDIAQPQPGTCLHGLPPGSCSRCGPLTRPR